MPEAAVGRADPSRRITTRTAGPTSRTNGVETVASCGRGEDKVGSPGRLPDGCFGAGAAPAGR